MNRSQSASYDLFKLIVALILAAILILMLLRGCATNPVAPAAANTIVPTSIILQPTAVVVTPVVRGSASLSAVPPTAAATSTSTAVAPSPTATASATPEASQPTEVTPTPETATAVPGNTSCNTTVPSRLSVGSKARVSRRLNMRSQPAIEASILQVNSTGTQVEIIGGPVCTPKGEHAYQWWQIRLANGAEGWSAESPLNEAGYFLEPLP